MTKHVRRNLAGGELLAKQEDGQTLIALAHGGHESRLAAAGGLSTGARAGRDREDDGRYTTSERCDRGFVR